ncbi:MAG: outer membrane lipoprotein carrier protein LolA [Endomicrobia bacterium]|nr:outer membrane lipoprotein carrier protein LolA [Endomicrobiia bacterium]MCL2799878.1 outer membrane lipoprotein carrier protein LolA [Endomicrobiia bacterium]
MKKIIFAALFVSCLCVPVFAQTNGDGKTIDYVLKNMEEADKKINTLEVDYVQEIFYNTTNEKQKITGNLKYKKPSNIFIAQRTPQEQKIYIDGKKITIYTPENSQAVVDTWKNVVSGDFAPASIISFGSNRANISKDHDIILIGEDDDHYIVGISPKSKKDWDMKLFVSKKTFYPQKASVSTDGLLINVDLTQYKTNVDLKKDLFKFNAPEGVEIIKLN